MRPQLDLIYLYVRNIERSLRFYRDLLGMPLTQSPNGTWAECEPTPGIRFALNQAGSYERPTPRTAELCFRVRSLARTRRRLADAGVRVSPVERGEWGEHFHAFDPDGYRISFYRAADAQQHHAAIEAILAAEPMPVPADPAELRQEMANWWPVAKRQQST